MVFRDKAPLDQFGYSALFKSTSAMWMMQCWTPTLLTLAAEPLCPFNAADETFRLLVSQRVEAEQPPTPSSSD